MALPQILLLTLTFNYIRCYSSWFTEPSHAKMLSSCKGSDGAHTRYSLLLSGRPGCLSRYVPSYLLFVFFLLCHNALFYSCLFLFFFNILRLLPFYFPFIILRFLFQWMCFCTKFHFIVFSHFNYMYFYFYFYFLSLLYFKLPLSFIKQRSNNLFE